jgi:hypothetical protein
MGVVFFMKIVLEIMLLLIGIAAGKGWLVLG